MGKSFEQLINYLKGTLSETRNNDGGHGQGQKIRPTPPNVASYALNIAAASIVFLVECFKASKS